MQVVAVFSQKWWSVPSFTVNVNSHSNQRVFAGEKLLELLDYSEEEEEDTAQIT